jgi:hypothetical protein
MRTADGSFNPAAPGWIEPLNLANLRLSNLLVPFMAILTDAPYLTLFSPPTYLMLLLSDSLLGLIKPIFERMPQY